MIDSKIINAINERNNIILQSKYEYIVAISYSSDEELERILFSPPEAPKAAVFALEKFFLGSTRGVLAISENNLYFYSFIRDFVANESSALPLSLITGVKINEFHNWKDLEINYKTEKGKVRKWKFKMPDSVKKLEYQQENIKVLLECLGEYH